MVAIGIAVAVEADVISRGAQITEGKTPRLEKHVIDGAVGG